MVDEVGLLLGFLHGYNAVGFLKPAIPLRLSTRLNLGLILPLKTPAI